MRPRPSPITLALLVLAAMVLVDVGTGAHAERRTNRRSTPVTPSKAAPDVTGTISPPKTAVNEDDEVLKPYFLPTAPRSHMRACGEKWQAVKTAGQAADQTWRDFATKCLTDMAEPAKPSH